MSENDLNERGQLQPGETLLCCERKRPSTLSGVLLLIVGLFFLWAGIAPVPRADGSINDKIEPILAAVGLFFAYPGVYIMFLSRMNYYFVTDKRLCIRETNLFFRPRHRDIPRYTIQAVKKGRRGLYLRAKIYVWTNEDINPVAFRPMNIMPMIEAMRVSRPPAATEDSMRDPYR